MSILEMLATQTPNPQHKHIHIGTHTQMHTHQALAVQCVLAVRAAGHTHTPLFCPAANAVSMFAECRQEVMRYLKGSRWPYNRALRADTHTHPHTPTDTLTD